MIAISILTNERLPTDILIDFEVGAIKTIQTVFANTNVNESFFRLCLNLWKQVQNVGLQVRCVEEPEFALQL